MPEHAVTGWRHAAGIAPDAPAPTPEYVRVIVVVNWVRGTVHSITSDQDEARRHVAELIAKYPGHPRAATQTAWVVEPPARTSRKGRGVDA